MRLVDPHQPHSRLPLGRADLLATVAIRETTRSGLPIESLTPVGSLRRYAPDVGDVSLLAVADPRHHAEIRRVFSRLSVVTRLESETDTRVDTRTDRGRLTLHLADAAQAGAALVWHTGSRAHTTRLQQIAAQHGLTLDDDGLRRGDGTPLLARTEEELYAHLSLAYIPPELREGGDEIIAAQRAALPSLVSTLHIRGDLHTHSVWSDGRDTIPRMVETARQLGYEYIAVTDHSERSAASRTLRAPAVLRQRAEIEALRAAYPDITILHGVEVDIMPDGSLDFDDALLDGFDIVLASLHDPAGQEPAALTARCLAAIRHPLVNVLTHPMNRTPALSPGYDLDFDRLFQAAAQAGTAVEVDGAPAHLDLDGSLARRAVEAGATLVVDSDSHRADALARQMRFGVGTARRGWVEPRHVLNTRSIDAVREFVARKRTSR